jgi:CDP-4-dehydro-6-deoxyglucose reductase
MSFTITLQPSGHKFQSIEGRSIMRAGIDAGFSMPYSCQSGVCRTCMGTVVAGTVDYGMVHPQYLSDADKAKGKVLLCQATAVSDCTIEIRELEGLDGIVTKIVPCRVMKLAKPAHGVAILSLRLPMNENMRFLAGQYVEFILKDGVRRSYSIANPPKTEGVIDLELHVRHTPGGVFTDRVFSVMKERELLRFEGPLGTFYLREDSAKPIILLASGTGFAPIKAICEYAFAKGIEKTRPMTLYWGCRTRADLYLLDLPTQWASEHPGFRFVPVLSDPTAACAWTGRTGYVHRAVMADFPDMSAYQVYACGAPIVIDSARRDFTGLCKLYEEEYFADSFITEADRAAA